MGRMIRLFMSVLGYLAAATALAQSLVLVWLWRQGAFTPAKREKIAAIAFGFNIRHWDSRPSNDPSAPAAPEQLFRERVQSQAILAERQRATKIEREGLRRAADDQRIARDKYQLLRQAFLEHLDRTEVAARERALGELRATLAALPPKQAKDLVLKLLADGHNEVQALSDLLEVLRSLPPNQTKKLLAEFKSANEQDALHRILVELGDLDLPRT